VVPAAGNGVSLATGLNITTNDPTDANLPADTNFQAGWVRHLTNTWHSATNGGLVYYIMDNEWSLWQSTHRDIHPVGPTMDEVFTDYCNYATMVKGIDPNALVAGPEEWSWPGYFYSGYDQQWSGAHNDYNPADYPDRIAHGGQDFGPWFLSQVNSAAKRPASGCWMFLHFIATRRKTTLAAMRWIPRRSCCGTNPPASSGTPIMWIPVGSTASSRSFPG
jgi:hypothetical protein